MLLVTWQAASQARLRPAVWSPRVARFHSTELLWTLRCSVAQGVAELLAITRNLADRGWSVHSVDEGRGCVVLNRLTPWLKWLDQARFRFEPYGQGCKVEIYACSTGFLPLIVPLAPVLNCALFFLPFFDGTGACAASVEELRALIARRGLIAGTSVRRMSLSSTALPSTATAPEQLAPASDALGRSP
jgi:hypothetical protein